jgi:hypothetical protein
MISRKLRWMPGSVDEKPADRVRADRVEGDVAEVEQAGEPDHDVQPEGEHDVREGEDAEVERRAERVEQRRQDRDDDEYRYAERDAQLVAVDVGEDRWRAHQPASRVSSPIRPCGLKVMIRIR